MRLPIPFQGAFEAYPTAAVLPQRVPVRSGGYINPKVEIQAQAQEYTMKLHGPIGLELWHHMSGIVGMASAVRLRLRFWSAGGWLEPRTPALSWLILNLLEGPKSKHQKAMLLGSKSRYRYSIWALYRRTWTLHLGEQAIKSFLCALLS